MGSTLPAVIDQYSVATLPLELRFGSTFVSIGTGFVWQWNGNFFLISNWHVLSGRDPFTQKHLSSTAAEPDRVSVWWNKKGALGSKIATELQIRDADGKPLWLAHPQYGSQVDVVALPVAAPVEAEMFPINEMPQANLLVQVGVDVFILGYPFGVSVGGLLPIWKRGSLASEPQVIDPARPVILVDSASRPGMSGSPVIRRSWGTHQMEGGGAMMNGAPATRLVGVYSGRLATTDPNDPQLGLTWPITFVDEIIAGNKRDA
jgi:hypothetical protein